MNRYLALGDSYTIGEGVEVSVTWPYRLAALLADAGFAPVPDIVAKTGWTADELLVAIESSNLSPPYDLVSVLVGVNDQYRDREVAEHLPHFNTLLSQAIGFADGDPARVFVVSIPDWGVSDFATDDRRGRRSIADAIDGYNAAQRELCALRGIAYADIAQLSRMLAGDRTMFVGDRLHPSGAQYARWLEVIAPVARGCLR